MAKRNTAMTEEKIQRWLAEGRGKGHGRDYKPWFTVRDVASIGREHRTYSHTVGRTHHLLSDLEFAFFLVLDMSKDIVDIREQFPLPREATRTIAKQLKFRHPRQPGANCDFVMTTDFVATRVVDGIQVIEAYAVKQSKDLENARVKQKLDIEEAYWTSIGVRFAVLTEAHISANIKKALKWLHPVKTLLAAEKNTWDLIAASSRRLLLSLAAPKNSNELLTSLCNKLDIEANTEEGAHLLAARFLFANRMLLADFVNVEIWRTIASQTSINERLALEELFIG